MMTKLQFDRSTVASLGLDHRFGQNTGRRASALAATLERGSESPENRAGCSDSMGAGQLSANERESTQMMTKFQFNRVSVASLRRCVRNGFEPAMPSRRCARPGAAALAALLIALPAMAPAQVPDRIALTAAQQRAFGVALAAPAPAEQTLSRRYPGEVAVPNRQLRVVATPQAGVIETLLVAEGDQVEAGQVLARLASPDLVDAQSAYLEAVTSLELAETDLARDRQLQREGVIAERRLLETAAKHTQLATMVDQRRQLLALAGMSDTDIEQLTRTRRLSSSLPVRTPIGGVVLEQMVATGESVAAAEPLYRVAELDPLWIEVHVPVERVAGLVPGNQVLLPELGSAGRIATIGRMVHGQDQGVLVRAEVHEGVERLRPGQFVQVQLGAATAAGVARWRVPAAAVVRNAGAAYVFAARDDGFAVLPVTVIAEEEDSAVVGGPIEPGDRIAVGGVVALKAIWLGNMDGEG
jgi:RND family efflux transporter MFP subunit